MTFDKSPTVRRIVGPTIPLRSGVYFDFLDPESCEFTIEDVAWGLSNLCRFTGQTRFYSVAQHSLHVSEVVAAEFVLNDMSKPLKVICPDYCALEKRIMPVVLARFGVDLPLDPRIKQADIRMLATEQQQLWDGSVAGDRWQFTYGREPYPIILPAWGPDEARQRFMDRFHQLRADALSQPIGWEVAP
jgi:hypothetical protein